MARESFEEVVEQIVNERHKNGATLDDVRARLKDRGVDKSPSLIRTVLRRMALEQRLVVTTQSTGRPGNPELVYFHINVAQEVMGLGEPVRRTEVERELLRREVLGGMAPLVDSARRIIEGDPVMTALEGMALELSDENPKRLLLRMADWAVQRAREIEANILNSREQDERQEGMRRLKLLAEYVERTFHRVVNIDRFTLRINPYALERDALGLPRAGSARDNEVVTYNRARVEQLLDLYVFGDRFVEVENIPPEKKVFSIACTDASIQEIPLWQEIPGRATGYWATREVHALTTSAASLQVSTPTSPPLFDFDIDPRRLQEYDTQTSIREGLLLPGDIMHRLGPDKWMRCKFAAMNIRQYRHDDKVLRGEGAWRQENLEFVSLQRARLRSPNVLFRDGRLFPLEHRLDNYEASDLYGEFVRRSSGGLAALASRPSVQSGDCVVAGVVKSPMFAVFAPIILWYIHENRPDAVDEETVLSADYPDGVLVQPILKAKAEYTGYAESRFVVTFRILRRFVTLAGKKLDKARLGNEAAPATAAEPREELAPVTPAEWNEWFGSYVTNESRLDETELEPEDYRDFIYLCGHVGALEFFLHPADGRLKPSYRMPRYEILVSSEERRQFFVDRERERVRRVLGALAPKDAIAEDSPHSDSEAVLFVPKVLVEADRAAAFASDSFKRMLIASIWEIYQDMKKGQASTNS